MNRIISPFSASITELKKNPSALLQQAEGEAIAILNHNSPTAYLVPAPLYEALQERLEGYELGQLVQQRQHEKPDAIKVTSDDL
jgi:antitoxin StbD